MSRFKALEAQARVSILAAAAMLCASSLRAGAVSGYFRSSQAILLYHSESAVELGERLTGSNSNGYLYFNRDLIDGVTQYLHFVLAGAPDANPYFVGSLETEDGGFVFPNGDYVVTTDAVHWVGGEGGLGSPNQAVIDIGANGSDPWGLLDGIPTDARLIWTGSGTNGRYFSIRIEPGDPAAIHTVDYSNDSTYVRSSTGQPLTRSFADENTAISVGSDRGVIGGRSEAMVSDGKNSTAIYGSAAFEATDFMVTPTGGQSTVDLSMNLRLKGILQGGAGAGDLILEQGTSSVYLAVEARIDGRRVFDQSVEITARRSFGTPTEVTEIAADPTDWFAGVLPSNLVGDVGDYVLEFSIPMDEIITTDTAPVQVGVPFRVSLLVEISSSALNNNGRVVAVADFTDGLGFPASGDVFNLPAGFTVNSVASSVEGNRHLGRPSPLPFTEGIFLRVGTISGESVAKGYEGWIDVDDFGSRIDRPDGFSRSVSATHGDLVVEKRVDAASVKLLEGATNGIVFPEVVLIANLPELGGARAALEYRLKNAAVTEFMAAGQGEDSAMESVALDYERVDWIYRLLAADGTTTGEVMAWWDVETNTGGSSSSTGSNTPPIIETVGNQPVDPGDEGSVGLMVSDGETSGSDLLIHLSTDRPDLIGALEVTGSGENRIVSFRTSALRSGFASILVELSDGTDTRSVSIPILIDVEMTPYEGFLSAYFAEDELFDPYLSAPLEDPDGDGLATQLEFLLGTNPREFNPADEAMKVEPDPRSGGESIVIKFRRRVDDPNVKGFFWGSEDTENWVQYDLTNARYSETTEAGPDSLYENVTATITLPDGKKPLFIRYQSVGVF